MSMKLVSGVALDDGQKERLRSIAPDLEIVDAMAWTDEEVRGLLRPDMDILCAFRVPGEVLEVAPNLRWLQLLSAGCDRILDHPIMTSGLPITTSSGVHATPIAEYVLATILAHYRWLPQAIRAQTERRWLSQNDVARHARELRRRTVGIIGYGSIGREVARLVKTFGARVVAMKREPAAAAETGYVVEGTGDDAGSLPERIFGPEELSPFLAECDVVVLSVPLTNETQRMLGATEFAAMKSGSFLVNIARGEVVDEAALIDALRDGPLGGAALDVFEEEPLPETSPLWDMENVMVTPHMSGASRPYLRRAFELFAQNLERFVADRPMLNLVDPERGY